MEQVCEVWHQAFCEQPDGLAYLESHGIYNRGLLRELKAGGDFGFTSLSRYLKGGWPLR
jgi:hypothetical protein